MGVRLTEDEAWEVVENCHTGIVTTLKRDGWPISLPVWFVVIDRRIYLTTPAKTKKVLRVANDERACFLVESGLAWRELEAVVLPARATIVEDEKRRAQVQAAVAEKYADFTVPTSDVSERTRAHYAAASAVIALEPTGRIISWNNARIVQPQAAT